MQYIEAYEKIQQILLNKNDNQLQKIIDFLFENFTHYNWIGIYIVKNNCLILGHWRGKQATEHTKIPIGKGICGSAAKSGKTELIENVHEDERYLACFTNTKSEIVVPIKINDTIIGEIDIDSDEPGAFTKDDKEFLEKIADMIKEHIC
jgi:GAF domain-containing protein